MAPVEAEPRPPAFDLGHAGAPLAVCLVPTDDSNTAAIRIAALAKTYLHERLPCHWRREWPQALAESAAIFTEGLRQNEPNGRPSAID